MGGWRWVEVYFGMVEIAGYFLQMCKGKWRYILSRGWVGLGLFWAGGSEWGLLEVDEGEWW